MTLFSFLPIWTWFIGAFGVVGVLLFAAALFAAPTLAAWFGARIAAAITTVLSNPLGAFAVALLLGIAYGSIHTAHNAAATCQAHIDQIIKDSQAAQQQRDADAEAQTEATYGPIIANLTAQRDAMQQQVNNDAAQIANKPTDCPLGPNPLRLRNGTKKSGAVRPK